jgi:tetratricopeptide (TPR) repeat protein
MTPETNFACFTQNSIDFAGMIVRDDFRRVVVRSLKEYIAFFLTASEYWIKLLYRGQSRADWKVESGACRALTLGDAYPSTEELKKHHQRLIAASRHLYDGESGSYNDLALLARLQHHKAKTNLIDFTESPLIALWFACAGEKGYDGAVHWVSEAVETVGSDDKLDKIFNDSGRSIYKYDPPYLERRMIAQQSTFLIAPDGRLKHDYYQSVIIPADVKDAVITELEFLGISQKRVYPDFDGFVEWFDHKGRDRLEELWYEGKTQTENREYTLERKSYEEALKITLDLFGPWDERTAMILTKLTHGVTFSNDALEFAERCGEWALAIRLKLFGDNRSKTAEAYSALATLYRKLGRYGDSENYYGKALGIMRCFYGGDSRHVSLVLNNLGYMYYDWGYYEKAKTAMLESLDIRSKLPKTDNSSEAYAYSNLASIALDMGDGENARKWASECLRIRLGLYGDDSLSSAIAYKKMARYECGWGDIGKAAELLAKAFGFHRAKRANSEKPDKITSSEADCLLAEGDILLKKGDADGAIERYTTARSALTAIFGEMSCDVAEADVKLGETYLKTKRFPEADGSLRRACSVYLKKLGEGSARTKGAFTLLRKAHLEIAPTVDFEAWLAGQPL